MDEMCNDDAQVHVHRAARSCHVRFCGTVRLQITFDDRERDLYDAFCGAAARPNMRVRCQRLDLGDVLIRPDGDGDPGPIGPIVVERKRVADLMASVLDGRLAEQRARPERACPRRGAVCAPGSPPRRLRAGGRSSWWRARRRRRVSAAVPTGGATSSYLLGLWCRVRDTYNDIKPFFFF